MITFIPITPGLVESSTGIELAAFSLSSSCLCESKRPDGESGGERCDVFVSLSG